MITQSPLEVPPGQVWGKKWVIYAALGVPEVDIERWRLRIDGMAGRSLEYSYRELLDSGLVKYKKPFHCVTGWSIKDADWEGVPIARLAKQAEVSESDWVMFHCLDGYTAPVPAGDALANDAIVALRLNGKELTKEQGFPARPFMPSLYGWKSAKWLSRIEFRKGYRDGYWEMFGYHERADVWDEERFKGHSGKHSRRTAIGTA